ncbi:glycosyltransferase family 4 protein [Xanthomarina spongicola]|uniref:Glycosyltransferase involved in cell wall biosynthesis n=1 Tax=Xanthomarina spongicola TaxID=570520 RepID=A0A316DME4_9FLAO|nr:glycosyltransferase family 4 protein [Xanthomarina spongicola]PWK17923.1 glycosyltransferase involved in cell wall biosynthesis [Xanthomarina spongicola]
MDKNLLIIGFVWPEPNSSAAGSRMLQLIDLFKSENYNITFATPCSKSDNAFNLETIEVKQVSIELNHSSFDDFIKKLNPNVVLFDRFMMEEQFGWRVTEQCPNALRILDTEDLHGLRKGRQLALKEGKPFNLEYLFNNTSKREIASIYRCDLSLIISEAEMEILKSDFKVPDTLLCYLPFMIEKISKAEIKKQSGFNSRQHFITIGNFLHEPNYNAILYLKETIWPLVRKQLPKAELHIYGAYVSQKVNQLHNQKEGFLIKGFAEEVSKVMQEAKVCLAPIRFGAGLKGKLIDAMQHGTPCVTTNIGAEGMFGEFEPNGFIEDNPQEFADKCVALYENEILWNEKQQNGFEIINKRFQKSVFQSKFLIQIQSIEKDLETHRLNNFTGLMLQHQIMQSTKYMSKWIEEKNK